MGDYQKRITRPFFSFLVIMLSAKESYIVYTLSLITGRYIDIDLDHLASLFGLDIVFFPCLSNTLPYGDFRSDCLGCRKRGFRGSNTMVHCTKTAMPTYGSPQAEVGKKRSAKDVIMSDVLIRESTNWPW